MERDGEVRRINVGEVYAEKNEDGTFTIYTYDGSDHWIVELEDGSRTYATTEFIRNHCVLVKKEI